MSGILVKSLDASDFEHLKKWCPWWTKQGVENNSTVYEMHLDRLELCLLTYVDGELACVSGVEDIGKGIYRILTRAATTPHRPRSRSREFYENNLYPWRGHAGFEVAYIRDLVRGDARFIMTTNYGAQSTRSIEKWKGKFRCIEADKSYEVYLHHTHQIAWPVNGDACIEMGKEMFPAWEERLNRL